MKRLASSSSAFVDTAFGLVSIASGRVTTGQAVQPYNPPPITTFGDRVNSAIQSYPLNKGLGNNPTDADVYPAELELISAEARRQFGSRDSTPGTSARRKAGRDDFVLGHFTAANRIIRCDRTGLCARGGRTSRRHKKSLFNQNA